VDFDGLILTPTKLLKEHPELKEEYHKKIKYLMVDEFQDTSAMQMDLVKELIGPHENIAVVGDDDQSIYGWRGAEIKNILSFPKQFKNCQVIRLEINYRSSPEIINLANAVISKNENRHSKVLKPHINSVSGEKPEVYVFEDEAKECEEVVNLVRNISRDTKLKDIAILYRSNAQGGFLEGLLKQSRIPYDLTGGPNLMDRKEVRDALSFIKAAISPDDLSLRRIVNLPPRGVGDVSVRKLLDLQEMKNSGFLSALRKWREAGLKEKVGLSIEDFLNSLKNLRDGLIKNDDTSYEERFKKFFTEVGLKDLIFSSYKDFKTGQKKWELIEILGRILDIFLSRADDRKNRASVVKDFLESMMLRESDSKDDNEDKLQMLTLHASKGLEFPVVILMGVDEGLIPHEKLGHNISEERRLFYVGVTRAKTSLIMTRASTRKRYGKRRQTSATRFLVNVADDLYLTYKNGFKPVSEVERKDMLKDLYKSLDKRILEKST
jgi:DNA helicase-2/ATP-dependent DNA helicase PcrA